MEPKAFLQVALKLLETNHDEAELRSAVSRAYYSAYHLIRIEVQKQIKLTLIQQSGLGSKKLIAHEKLCNALMGSTKIRSFGDHLNDLRLARINADYQIETVVSYAQAKSTVDSAQKFWNDTQSFGV